MEEIDTVDGVKEAPKDQVDVGSTKEEKPVRNGHESKSPDHKTPENLSPETRSPASESPQTERISWSPDKEVRDSPERETESGSGRSTPLDGSSTPRRIFSAHNLGELATGSLGRKVKKRYFSGEKKKMEKFENVPSLDPFTTESFKVFMEYVTTNKFDSLDIQRCLTNAEIAQNLRLQDCPNMRTGLHIAASEGNPVVVDALLSLGHDPLALDLKGYLALHLAVHQHNNGIVKKLLAANPNGVNTQCKQGFSPLHVAALSQNHDAIRMIRIQAYSDFALKDSNGRTALHLAVILLKKSSDEITNAGVMSDENFFQFLDAYDRIQNIIIYLLDIIKTEELVESLQLDSTLNGPLHLLSELDCFQNVRTICKRVPPKETPVFELQNCEGLTPLLICLGKMFIGEIEKLDFDNIRMMIDIEESRKRQNNRKNKRSHSVPDSPMGCAKLLLERISSETVDLPHPKLNNMTALQIVLNNVEKTFSSSEEEYELVEQLLRNGANVMITHGTSAGEPPIHLVNSQNFDRKLAVLFIEHLNGETINLQDDMGQTVLHLAVSQMDEERVELILRKGANIMMKDRIVESEDIDMTRPGMQTSGQLHFRTPLLVALRNGASKITLGFAIDLKLYSLLSGKSYFKAISKVGLEKILKKVEDVDLMEFLQTHISAAASTKNNQALRQICQLLSRGKCSKPFERLMTHSHFTETEVLYEVVHFYEPDHFEKTFHKTALAWTNENDDPISASELLHFEHDTHESKKEGLQCMKNQLTNDKLLYWITRTFSRFYSTPKVNRWATAVIVPFFQLGVFSYGSYIFDVVSDLALMTEYGEAYPKAGKMQLYEMWNCAQEANNSRQEGYCFKTGDPYPETTYFVAYILTIVTMLISVAVYIIGIFFFFDTKNITEKYHWIQQNRKNGFFRRVLLDWMLPFGIRLVWPLLHLIRRIKYEASRNKSSRRKNLIEFERIWIMVKSIEYGIEATVQVNLRTKTIKFILTIMFLHFR